MLLVLFRHGPAGIADPTRWADDAKRPLSPRGIEKTRRAARGLKGLLGDEPRLLSSPLVRAKETADLLATAYAPALPVDILEALATGRPLGELMSRLVELGEGTFVLVGHEPGLGRLAGLLVCGESATLPLKKAGACAIELEGKAAPGRGSLKWLATPRILRGLAG
jgi:phosphohistidine phosphatase